MRARFRVDVRAIRDSESRKYNSNVQLCWSAQVALQPGVLVARLVVCIVQQNVCAIAGAPFVAHRIRRVLLLFDGLAASLRSRVGRSRRYLRNAERGHRGPLVRAQRLLGKKTRFADFFYTCSVCIALSSCLALCRPLRTPSQAVSEPLSVDIGR